MFEEFDRGSQTKIVRDAGGIARVLSHSDRYIPAGAVTPQHSARDYLSRYGRLLGLPKEHLKNLSAPLGAEPSSANIEYRFLSEKRHSDLTTVAYHQTCLGLPVWEAGVSVTMKHNPLRVLGARSTMHADLKIKRPSAKHVLRAKSLDVESLAKSLGLSGRVRHGGPLSINSQHLMIYRYNEAAREGSAASPRKRDGVIHDGKPGLPLPRVHRSIRNGRHYVVAACYFCFDFPPIRPLHWVALIEVETSSVLLLRPFIDNVMAWVFRADPATLGGSAANAGDAALNPFRSSVKLAGLDAPKKGIQALRGTNVVLSDIITPTIAPPTMPAGKNFKFNARTNHFAAVSAYYNCDRVFRLVEDLGFSLASYFPGTIFPSPVDHRGHYDKAHPQGDEINAHCAGNASGTGVGYTTFSLADLSNQKKPIGIACDWRIVLHELLGHGVLYNHIGAPRFAFAHSAGDSFASIINDPGSKAQDRGDTFPWLAGIAPTARRRHDRAVAAGWGWNGDIALHPFDPVKDGGGYCNEQILSSTMFHFYRSIGGNSTDIAMKRFAARMTCHLLLAAIQTLTSATSPTDAAHLASALAKADLATWVAEGISGGAYHKVIRWAFEKQGLYQAAGTATPNNDIGTPPPVDVYIEDGRHGEYRYQVDYWNCRAIWNRRHRDGGARHEEPIGGVVNFAYVKIKNRGSERATKVTVRAFHSQTSAGTVFPDDWKSMKTAQLVAANVPPHSSAEVVVGPFAWVPSRKGGDCMLMIASTAGDPSNIDNLTAGETIPNWRLVPNDNNIGQRSVFPVRSATAQRLVKGFGSVDIVLKNPFNIPARMKVKVALPSFLRKREWQVILHKTGNRASKLEPGSSRNMNIRLRAGRTFSAADLRQTKKPAIEIAVSANGIGVGGMTYPLETEKNIPDKKPR